MLWLRSAPIVYTQTQKHRNTETHRITYPNRNNHILNVEIPPPIKRFWNDPSFKYIIQVMRQNGPVAWRLGTIGISFTSHVFENLYWTIVLTPIYLCRRVSWDINVCNRFVYAHSKHPSGQYTNNKTEKSILFPLPHDDDDDKQFIYKSTERDRSPTAGPHTMNSWALHVCCCSRGNGGGRTFILNSIHSRERERCSVCMLCMHNWVRDTKSHQCFVSYRI